MLYWWRDSPAWKRMTSLDVPSSPDLKNSFKRRWVGGHIPAHDVKHIRIFSPYPPSPSPSFSVKFACGCKCGEGVTMWREGCTLNQRSNEEILMSRKKERKKERRQGGRKERKIKWQTERKKERKKGRQKNPLSWLADCMAGFPMWIPELSYAAKILRVRFFLVFFFFFSFLSVVLSCNWVGTWQGWCQSMTTTDDLTVVM